MEPQVGCQITPYTKKDLIQHPKTNLVQADREKISNLIVCHSSTADNQQLQLPNDAASYDPTGNQSGLLRHAPQLKWPARLPQHRLPQPAQCTTQAFFHFSVLVQGGKS